MKTIRNTKTGEIKRLNDKEAHKAVTVQGYLGWSYVPKEMWKNEVRGPVGKKEQTKTNNTKNETDTTTRKTSNVKTKKTSSR